MRHVTTLVDWDATDQLVSVATRGGLRSAVTGWARFALQFVALLLLARILGPARYGSAAAALVAVTAAELLRSGAVSWLVARSRDLTPALASTLHATCTAVGAALGLCVGLLGTVVQPAALPGGALTFPLLGLVLLTAGLGAVPTALLVRNLHAGTVALTELVAAVASVTVALTAALLDLGALSLLLQAAVYAAVLCALTTWKARWRPCRPAPLRALRPHLGFLGAASVTQGLDWVVRSVDRLVVALLFGPAAAGLYTQAAQLVTLPVEQVHGPLRRLAVPALGRLHGDPAVFRAAYRTIVTIAATVLWPALALLGVLADDVVALAYGSAWHDTADLFRAMLPTAFATVITGVTAMVTLAAGAAGRQALWECVVSRPAVVAAFALGIPGGVTGVAVATSVATAVLVLPGHAFVARRCDLHLGDLVRPLLAPAVVSVVTVVAAVVVRASLGDHRPSVIVIVSAVGVATALVTATVLRPTRTLLAQALTHLRTRTGPARDAVA